MLANENEAQLLGIQRGAPLVMLDSISYTESGQPIEYYHALHRGDRSRFEVELLRLREPEPGLADTVGGLCHHAEDPHDGRGRITRARV